MKTHKPFGIAILALTLLAHAGCIGRSGDADPGSVILETAGVDSVPVKASILELTQRNYLHQECLPAKVQLADHPTSQALLSHLIAAARTEGKDRDWSALIPSSSHQAFYADGTMKGYGILVDLEAFGPFPAFVIKGVMPDSPAEGAGLLRGARILAAARSRDGLDKPGAQAPALAASGELKRLLTDTETESTLWLRAWNPGAALSRDLPLKPVAFRIDPVPRAAAPLVLDAGAGRKVGYLPFLLFIAPAEEALRTAFGAFRAAGVTDLVVDLRYNPGGLLTGAQVLANLLHPHPAPGEVMALLARHARNAAAAESIPFQPEPRSFRPRKLAFIVTARSASASEAVINVLQPVYGRDLAVVGSRTYGKPVGAEFYRLPTDAWGLSLVTLRILNGRSEGGYYQGLPDGAFRGVSIAAPDDAGHPLGDPAEASLAAALAWMTHGTEGRPIPPGKPWNDARASREGHGATRDLGPFTPGEALHPGIY